MAAAAVAKFARIGVKILKIEIALKGVESLGTMMVEPGSILLLPILHESKFLTAWPLGRITKIPLLSAESARPPASLM